MLLPHTSLQLLGPGSFGELCRGKTSWNTVRHNMQPFNQVSSPFLDPHECKVMSTAKNERSSMRSSVQKRSLTEKDSLGPCLSASTCQGVGSQQRLFCRHEQFVSELHKRYSGWRLEHPVGLASSFSDLRGFASDGNRQRVDSLQSDFLGVAEHLHDNHPSIAGRSATANLMTAIAKYTLVDPMPQASPIL